jgi:hypothetical protein
LGLIYGIFLFPGFVTPRPFPAAMWLRATIATLAPLAFVAWIVWPLLPRTPEPEIDYCLIRVTPGAEPVQASWPDAPAIASQLKALRLAGATHTGISSASNSGGKTPVRVELVALDPITKQATLPVPKSGDVLYVLHAGVWTAYPQVGRQTLGSIMLKSGSDAQFDGAQAELSGEREFHAFTWYPTIPKGR